ncbi:MAG: ATP-binding protein [Thermoanaerobaculia bacterium]
MNEAAAPPEIVMWLSSRYPNIELAEALLDYVCQKRGLPDESEHWIGMALREALANAIKHGNRQDPEKRVLLALGGDAHTLEIEVGDEGAGFAPDDVADPLAPENQMKTSGRGIFYMRTFMDEVSFSRGQTGGTLLTLKKNVGTTSTTKGVESS